MDYIFEAVSPRLQYPGIALDNPHGVKIAAGRMHAIIGPNGAGKTSLANILARGWNFGLNKIVGDRKNLSIKVLEFTDIHTLSGCRDTYYQQRFEATMNDDMPTVGSLIEGKAGRDTWRTICNHLNLNDIESKSLNSLSSGELRKFLIANALSETPNVLFLDNPYIGLDAGSRQLLNDLLQRLSADGTAIVLLLCNPDDLPEFVDFVIPMSQCRILPTIDVKSTGIDAAHTAVGKLFATRNLGEIPVGERPTANFDIAFSLNDCRVCYGKTVILDHVDWTVRHGERWALLGPNGSGKSTLLSLVCADNPQSYCNDITIFDRRRGSGESIWDIKRRIGFLSPEIHLYFREARNVKAVVAAGLRDTVGMFGNEPAHNIEIAARWLDAFGIAHLAERRFTTLSAGEQRLVLLIRTLIKQPEMLILDEPLHGLDAPTKRLARTAIEAVTARTDATLVYVTHYESEIPSLVTKTKRIERIKG